MTAEDDKPTVEVIKAFAAEDAAAARADRDEADEAGPDHTEGPKELYDSSDPDQVQNARRKAGRLAKARREALVSLLSTKAGRGWVWGMLTFCRVFATSFDRDPHATAFNEGQRNVGLKLLADINNADPGAYVLMATEAEGKNG